MGSGVLVSLPGIAGFRRRKGRQSRLVAGKLRPGRAWAAPHGTLFPVVKALTTELRVDGPGVSGRLGRY